MRSLKSNRIGFKSQVFFSKPLTSLGPNSTMFKSSILPNDLLWQCIEVFKRKGLEPNWWNSITIIIYVMLYNSQSMVYLNSYQWNFIISGWPNIHYLSWNSQNKFPKLILISLNFFYVPSTLRKLRYTETKLWSVIRQGSYHHHSKKELQDTLEIDTASFQSYPLLS